MRLAAFSTTTRVGGRLGRALRQRRGLVERGVEAVTHAAEAVRDAAPTPEPADEPGRGHRQTAITIAAVTVTVAAVSTVAYLWWRHRREEEYARLFEPQPERPDPEPAASPDSGDPLADDLSGDDEPSTPVDETPARPAEPAEREPAIASALHEPTPPAEEEPVLTDPPEPIEPIEPTVPASPVLETRARQAGQFQARRTQQGDRARGGGSLPSSPSFTAPRTRTELPANRPLPPRPR